MSAKKDADILRASLALNPTAIIGGVGGCHEMLLHVLNRLDELEWIVSVMRGITPSTQVRGTDG